MVLLAYPGGTVLVYRLYLRVYGAKTDDSCGRLVRVKLSSGGWWMEEVGTGHHMTCWIGSLSIVHCLLSAVYCALSIVCCLYCVLLFMSISVTLYPWDVLYPSANWD